ncbi:MAG: methylthioadenosine phosphorylase [Chloroflexi bacterium RBG_16_68_14]|nr:MAG: methylthioadenosine phosphorylase [Chloroflexi bacterium RBG_16_68_14]
MSTAQLAVIGGSGFYRMEGLSEIEEVRPQTPFGPPSDAIVLGTLGGVRVAFLPRHGVGHRILPSELPARANIWALKQLGVERIIGVNAVGSLREEIAPLHLVVPDQLIDRTQGRPNSFFGRGLVAHIAFDQPFCPVLSDLLAGSAQSTGATVHRGGTCLVTEGPSFSTKAESQLYRSWGADIIGMTSLPEAKLAREAAICYVSLALVTDYDTWHEDHDPVSAEMILENLSRNVETAKRVVAETVRTLPQSRDCACASALATALVTPPHLVPEETKRDLAPIIGRYMPVEAAK